MAQHATAVPAQPSGAGRIGWAIMWILSVGLVAFLIVTVVIRFTTPIPLYRLRIEEDIPLPGPLPPEGQQALPVGQATSAIVPGLAQRFDHFDLQALDPVTHLLFIAHSGPPFDRFSTVADPNLHFSEAIDGNVIVFDTQQRKVVKLIQIPQTSGLAIATDIHWAYVSAAVNGIVWAINEQTFQTVPIKLDPLDGPDAMAYDPVDHRMFVSDIGNPAQPSVNANVALQNQNVAVINVLNNTLVTKVPLGVDKPFGDDVGHVQYDSTSHRVYVITLPLHDQNATFPLVTPPSYVDTIDPTLPIPRVVAKTKLPDACVGPHGLVIDSGQEIAFIACVEVDQLLRFNLRTMQPMDTTLWPLPFHADVLRIDRPLHLLFAAATGGIGIFDEANGKLVSLGSQFVGGNSNHTLAINEDTQEIYVPLPNVGNRPVLRILQYIPNGTEQQLQ